MKNKANHIDYAVVLLSSLGLFILWLGSMPLHMPDEARYSAISFSMLKSHDYLIPKIYGVAFLDKPPLFYYLQIGLMKLFSPSEFVLRLPSAILASLTTLFVYHTVRKLFDRKKALISAFILMTQPLYFLLSHYANMDMMVSSFITMGALSFLLAQRDKLGLPPSTKPFNHTRYLYMSYIFISLAFLSKGLISLAIPGMTVLIWAGIYRIKPRLALFKGMAICLSISLPWFILVSLQVKDFAYYFFVVQHFYRYLGSNFNNQQGVWFYFVILLVGCFPWFLFYRFNVKQYLSPVYGFFLILFGFTLIFFSIPSSKPIGYIAPTLAPIAVLIATQIDIQRQKSLLGFLIGLAATSGIVAIIAIHFMPQYQWHLIIATTVLITSSLISLNYFFKGHLNNVFNMTIVTMVFVNLIALNVIQRLPFDSSQPMANYIKQHVDKKTPLVMLYHVYFDVFYYLPDHQLAVCDNWVKGLKTGDALVEQFALGMQYHQPKSFILPKRFKELWQDETKRIYVLTDGDSYYNLKASGYLIKKDKGLYLLSNQPG